MKFSLLIYLLIAASIYAQQKRITFEVITNNLADTSFVFITGNHAVLGTWNPSVMQLNKKAQNKWSITLPFTVNTKVEYKFTLGSWYNEALKNDGTKPGNSILDVKNDTTITDTVKLWGGQPGSGFEGQITGTVKYHRNITGKKLKPRDVIVWLPPGYDKDVNKRYPVLYAHDGQNLFDPKTSAIGVDWQLDETADSLIKQGKLKEIIVVGIYNTPDRRQEYMSTDTGYAYMDFIINKLKPFIDKTYRTLTDRNNTATMGSSAGATISFMLHWEHNDVFGMAACISPAFKIYYHDFITPFVNKKAPHKDLKLYMDDGGVGLDSELLPGVKEMIKELKKQGYKEDKDFTFMFFPKAEHSEKDWAERLFNPLIYMFKKD